MIGATRPFDLFHVTQFDGKGQVERRVHGFLELMWALIADVDLESEHLRWAGSSRFTLMAVARVLKLRKYKGKLHYLGNAGAEVRVASTDLGSLRFDHVRPGAVPGMARESPSYTCHGIAHAHAFTTTHSRLDYGRL